MGAVVERRAYLLAGLDLTAANYVILLDPWWNPAVENQAADRVHRIGQKNPVTVYRLIAADTVEERVIELHREKKALAEDVLGEAGSRLGCVRGKTRMPRQLQNPVGRSPRDRRRHIPRPQPPLARLAPLGDTSAKRMLWQGCTGCRPYRMYVGFCNCLYVLACALCSGLCGSSQIRSFAAAGCAIIYL